MSFGRRTLGPSRTRMALWSGVPLVALAFAASAHAAPGSPGLAPKGTPVVVAILGEEGANVLHEEFQRDRLAPNRDLPPATAVALPRTGSFESRLEAARRGPLGHLAPGRLYRITGTNVVGVYYPPLSPNPLTRQPPADLFADREHGTGVLSALAGKRLGTAPNVQVVIVLGSARAGWEWVARQSWIDFVSTSYLQNLPGADPVQAVCDAQRQVEAINTRGGIVFTANGNDPGLSALPPASFPNVYHVGGVDASGRTVLVAPSAGAITTVLSPERPYETGELFDFPAASAFSLTDTTSFGATSGATPRMAGNAANLLALARQRLGDTGGRRSGDALARVPNRTTRKPSRGPLADGVLSRADLLDILHRTSTPHEVNPDTRYALEGFGAFDNTARRLAESVLNGTSVAPDRTPETTMDTATRAARNLMWESRCAIP